MNQCMGFSQNADAGACIWAKTREFECIETSHYIRMYIQSTYREHRTMKEVKGCFALDLDRKSKPPPGFMFALFRQCRLQMLQICIMYNYHAGLGRWS